MYKKLKEHTLLHIDEVMNFQCIDEDEEGQNKEYGFDTVDSFITSDEPLIIINYLISCMIRSDGQHARVIEKLIQNIFNVMIDDFEDNVEEGYNYDRVASHLVALMQNSVKHIDRNTCERVHDIKEYLVNV